MEKIEFVASLDPSVKTAVGFDNGGAGSIKLVTDAQQMAEVMKLGAFFREKTFKMVIEALPKIDENDGTNGKLKTYAG